jgi:WhiB family redox-sensing transcriptional regulator
VFPYPTDSLEIDTPAPLYWVLAAACTDLPSDLFFAEDEFTVERAKQICATCPVVDDCLEWGDEVDAAGLASGIFGGLTANERAELRDGPRVRTRLSSFKKNRGDGIKLLGAEKRCKTCWKPLSVHSGRGRRPDYCSARCKRHAFEKASGRSGPRRPEACFCQRCGTAFRTGKRGPIAKYCSEACARVGSGAR